jgi:hypothetical protein
MPPMAPKSASMMQQRKSLLLNARQLMATSTPCCTLHYIISVSVLERGTETETETETERERQTVWAWQMEYRNLGALSSSLNLTGVMGRRGQLFCLPIQGLEHFVAHGISLPHKLFRSLDV